MTVSPGIRSDEVPIGITGSGVRGVDLDDGQVGLHVAGEQFGDVTLAVGQGDVDLADAVDDVVIGDDVAAGVDDHAGAHAVDAAAGVGRGPLPGRRARRRFSRRGC